MSTTWRGGCRAPAPEAAPETAALPTSYSRTAGACGVGLRGVSDGLKYTTGIRHRPPRGCDHRPALAGGVGDGDLDTASCPALLRSKGGSSRTEPSSSMATGRSSPSSLNQQREDSRRTTPVCKWPKSSATTGEGAPAASRSASLRSSEYSCSCARAVHPPPGHPLAPIESQSTCDAPGAMWPNTSNDAPAAAAASTVRRSQPSCRLAA
mmetsp:Transcript_28450/g.91187  ORF Transcript_28450/g.91187 Transcript_28450/m.91187 type:complete len:209 (+) Transcript_28450:460-1086(+)